MKLECKEKKEEKGKDAILCLKRCFVFVWNFFIRKKK